MIKIITAATATALIINLISPFPHANAIRERMGWRMVFLSLVICSLALLWAL